MHQAERHGRWAGTGRPDQRRGTTRRGQTARPRRRRLHRPW
jgi:hypothetical protein